MKKYISPKIVAVPIMHIQPIAGSLTTDGATFYEEDATGAAMTKEQTFSSSSVWDDEW